MRSALAVLSEEELAASDHALLSRFLALPEAAQARNILLFFGVGTEVRTARLFGALQAAGKIIALPRCLPRRRMEARVVTLEDSLIPGAYGIPEPGESCPVLPRDGIDLILVPALCYDRLRFRLGQGGGYYDRYLAGYPGCTVGLCRDILLQERIPHTGTDLPVRILLTETASIR